LPLIQPRIDALNSDFEGFISYEEDQRHIRIRAAQRGAGGALIVVLVSALLLGLFLAFANRRQLISLSRTYERQAEVLRASEEHLGTTLKSIGDGVIATDGKGQITFLNPVAEHLTGWPQSEAQGKNLRDVFKIVDP